MSSSSILGGDSALPQRRPSIESHYFGNDLVLHDENGEKIHVLNGSAQLVWEHCDGETTLHELIETMRKKYEDVAREILSQDINDVISELQSKELFAPR